MLGFLIKIVMVALIVGGVGFTVMKKGIPNIKDFDFSSLPLNKEALSSLKETDTQKLIANVSSMLDSIVTHPGKNAGPVVLGVQVTNDSLNTVVDVLQNLPPEQVDQIRDAFCNPGE
jgi:hypothetical protein